MAKTYKAKVYLTTSSSTKTYTFAFDYINKRYIKGRLNGRELVWGTDYTVSGHSFNLVKPPPANGTLEVYRQTPSGKAVEWYDGSILRAKDLNLHNIQMLHITEENYDYFQDHFMAKDDHDNKWEARELIIKNVKDPVDAGDALNKKYFEAVSTGYLQKMQAGVDESKRQAGESTKQAGISTTEANRSKSEADRAKREADRAKAEADRAKREADKGVEKVTQVVKEGVNTVNTTVRDATASINTTTRQAITTINDEKAEAQKTIQQATERAVSEANRSQKEANKAKAEADRSKTEADRAKAEADRAATYKGQVTAEVTKAFKDINNTATTVKSEVTNAVTTAKSDIANTVTKAKSDVARTVSTAQSTISTTVEDAKSRVNATVSNAHIAIDNKVTAMSQAMDTKMASFDARTEQAVTTVITKADEVSATEKRLKVSVDTAVENVTNTLQAEKGKIVKDAVDSMNSAKSSAIETVESRVTSLESDAQQAAEKAINNQKKELEDSFVRKIDEINAIKLSANVITTSVAHKNDETADGTYRTFLWRESKNDLLHMGGFIPNSLFNGYDTVEIVPPVRLNNIAGIYWMACSAVGRMEGAGLRTLFINVNDDGLITIKGYNKANSNYVGAFWEIIAKEDIFSSGPLEEKVVSTPNDNRPVVIEEPWTNQWADIFMMCVWEYNRIDSVRGEPSITTINQKYPDWETALPKNAIEYVKAKSASSRNRNNTGRLSFLQRTKIAMDTATLRPIVTPLKEPLGSYSDETLKAVKLVLRDIRQDRRDNLPRINELDPKWLEKVNTTLRIIWHYNISVADIERVIKDVDTCADMVASELILRGIQEEDE